MKLNVGVIFGGRSVEHEMSIITAIQVMQNIDKEKYEIIPIYITKTQEWYTGGCLKFIETYKQPDLIRKYAHKVHLVKKDDRYVLQRNGFIKREISELHIAFPIGHGANIEDGSIQGYLNLIGIPYVGSNIYSSAIAQDKSFMKQVLKANDIPVVDFVWFGERFYKNKKEELFKQIEGLKYPLIIKPATLGSSVGIEVIKRKEELDSSIERAFQYDNKVIIEEKIDDLIEYQCSVLLTENGNITSEIEEITTNKAILEYSDKFLIDDSLEDSSIKRTYPAEISEKLKKEIETLSLAVFKILNMRGTARIDFLYDNKDKKIYVDEINSIPWCMSHHLWEARNISYQELLNIMLKDAIDLEIKNQSRKLTIDSDIIKTVTTNSLKEMK